MSKSGKRKGGPEEESQRRGPRGGTSTVTRSGMVKKNLWVRVEVADALRKRAFEERRSEADIIREGLIPMVKDWMSVIILLILVS